MIDPHQPHRPVVPVYTLILAATIGVTLLLLAGFEIGTWWLDTNLPNLTTITR